MIDYAILEDYSPDYLVLCNRLQMSIALDALALTNINPAVEQKIAYTLQLAVITSDSYGDTLEEASLTFAGAGVKRIKQDLCYSLAQMELQDESPPGAQMAARSLLDLLISNN